MGDFLRLHLLYRAVVAPLMRLSKRMRGAATAATIARAR